ncbi:MAG: hypothetical protein Q9227_004388 [Pyrenula ochraceoflavens]
MANSFPSTPRTANGKTDIEILPGARRSDSDEATFAQSDRPYTHKDSSSDEHAYAFYAEHGPPIDNFNNQKRLEDDYAHHNKLWWSRVRHYIRDPAAEFFGTFIMIVFGDGSVAQVLLSSSPNLDKANQNKGEYQSISWGWGIGVMLGVYVAGCAGGHLNPAVTFCNCLYRGFPWRKLPIYACAQVAGCFCGAAVIYGNYKSAINVYEGSPDRRTVPGYSETATAGVFCTYPQPFLEKKGQFFSEIIGSAVLIFVIFALKDDNNLGAGNMVPLALFFLIFGIGATLGWETGYAINLARDFGPRLFTYFVGYGHEVWSAGNYYFWIPMVAPFIGGTFGGFLYDVFVFTGKSPVNTPWLGLKRILRPDIAAVREEMLGKPKDADKSKSGREKVENLEFVCRTIENLLLNSSTDAGQSLNIGFLAKYFSQEDVNQEAFLCRSSLFERARPEASSGPLPRTENERQMSAKLHCLYGVPIECHGRTRSGWTYPHACSKVYDLRNYTDATLWGPFREDGSQRVDWERLEAIMVILGHNIQNFSNRAKGGVKPIWSNPFQGAYPKSFKNPLRKTDETSHVKEVSSSLEAQDPFGVTGTWFRVVCFLDYHELHAYNFSTPDPPPGVPRPALDTVEAIRLIIMNIRVTKVEPPGEDDHQSYPVVHFRGSSRSMHASWDPNANSTIRGASLCGV